MLLALDGDDVLRLVEMPIETAVEVQSAFFALVRADSSFESGAA